MAPASGAATGTPATAVIPNAPGLFVTSPHSEEYARQCRAAVDAALVQLGMNPGDYQMSFWEDFVTYPGGGYSNRCITVQSPEGYRMDFDAAATLRSPHITADAIRMLRQGYWDAPAAAPGRLGPEFRS